MLRNILVDEYETYVKRDMFLQKGHEKTMYRIEKKNT